MNSFLRIKLFVILLSFCYCFVQPAHLFGQYHFDSWTTDEGLPQNGVRAITQTPDGYLWFTTFDGLVRFDGVRFETFAKGNTKGIINNRFTSLHSDKDGTLYAATAEDGILTVYKKGVFSSFTSDQVPGNYIRAFKTDENGEVRIRVEDTDRKTDSWYVFRDGKFVFSETEKSKYEYTIKHKGKSGAIWTISNQQTIEQRNGKSVVYPHKISVIDSGLPMFEDSENRLWIGGQTLTTLKGGKIKSYGVKDGYPIDSLFHEFWQENDGAVWFANGGRSAPGVGLVRFKTGKFTRFGVESGLSQASIHDVFKDREGNIWIGTSKGINRLRENVITSYSAKDGLKHPEVYPLYRDSKDQIWIGSIKGLTLYKDGKFEDVNLRTADQNVPRHLKWNNSNISVSSIFEDSKGKMWIGASGGIFLVENGIAETIPDAESYFVYTVVEDSAGNIWAATNKGVLRFNDYELTAKFSTKEGLPHEFITVIKEDSKGRLWFGGLGGLSEFKNGKFINYTAKEGLTGNYIRTIYEDDEGTLWIGTYDEGLSRFKNGVFRNFKSTDGLFNNGVFAIEEDERGNFWISSNQGIYRVSRQELNDFADQKTQRISSVSYGKEDGMLNNECNGGRQPASLKDKDGKFWFPTQDGVVVIDPTRESYNALSPSVVVESASIERKPFDMRNGLIVEPGQRNIEIRFTGISMVKSNQIKFKYKLEGHDSDWIEADTRRVAFYSYLPPGKYTFRVKAANSDGVWSETGSSLSVEIKPYFYQTNLFYLLCLAIGAGVLLVIWKVSVNQLRSRAKLLETLVNERTEALESANHELEQLANSDGLTAIGNRRRFEEFLAGEWHRAIRFKTEISLILLDIDHFKLFNDKYGHLEGDECLKKVAKALNGAIHRPTDLVARFGGEEFAIVLGGTDAAGANTIANEVFECIKKLKIPHDDSTTNEYLTISVGVATTFAEVGMDESLLIQAADEALYEAKENGRNQIVENSSIPPAYQIAVTEIEKRDLIG